MNYIPRAFSKPGFSCGLCASETFSDAHSPREKLGFGKKSENVVQKEQPGRTWGPPGNNAKVRSGEKSSSFFFGQTCTAPRRRACLAKCFVKKQKHARRLGAVQGWQKK